MGHTPTLPTPVPLAWRGRAGAPPHALGSWRTVEPPGREAWDRLHDHAPLSPCRVIPVQQGTTKSIIQSSPSKRVTDSSLPLTCTSKRCSPEYCST